jgi:hypothetical protein
LKGLLRFQLVHAKAVAQVLSFEVDFQEFVQRNKESMYTDKKFAQRKEYGPQGKICPAESILCSQKSDEGLLGEEVASSPSLAALTQLLSYFPKSMDESK